MSDGIEVIGSVEGGFAEILTSEALNFVADLHRRFNPEREALLRARAIRQERLDHGELPDFLPETQNIRDGEWRVAAVPADLQDRRVEITGPVERKMMINALNSGAKVFMADFEDSNSPTWENNIQGHLNLIDAINGTMEFTSQDGKHYQLGEETATLMIRPRGWHLFEKHVFVAGHPISASLFDFGLYVFHNGKRSLERGTGPYFYLPKLESHLEARLWNDVFVYTEEKLGIQAGTIKATVLIETILAAFEMEEILYELRDHSAGLNAGRWDYIFSVIKKFRNRPEMVLPDRAQVSMTVPFMRAYSELLVSTCHRRGAFAIGGMAAFIPSRRDLEINEHALRKVREDKQRESADGCDGTWVAHPDLVAPVLEVFDNVLGAKPNQLDVLRGDVEIAGSDLLNTLIEAGAITEAGLRTNISVAILYLESWLRGVGAAALFNLMEDAATAEISRSQIWQWIRHDALMDDGRSVTRELVHELMNEEIEKMREAYGEDLFARGRFDEARHLFETVALSDEFPEFLTLRAYELID